MTPRRAMRRGFTRIELLALASALCVLIAMAGPARNGNVQNILTRYCADNLRIIARTAIQYAIENDDWIIGSPAGSGAYLLGESQAFGPAVQVWDFMGPMLHRWEPNAPLPQPGDEQAVAQRFNDIRSHSRLLDPANGFEAAHFAGPDAGIGPMISYNTTRNQLWLQAGDNIGVTGPPSNFDAHLPTGWRPSVSAMGNPANKVFCADGARFSTATIPPDYDLRVNASFGGAFSDDAPYSRFTHSWDRSRAPLNGGVGGTDARIYAYRHSIGQPPPGAEANAFKMNLVFYDGHFETQGDLTSSNPEQWLPQGTVLRTVNTWRDTRITYHLPSLIIIGP